MEIFTADTFLNEPHVELFETRNRETEGNVSRINCSSEPNELQRTTGTQTPPNVSKLQKHRIVAVHNISKLWFFMGEGG